MSERVKDEIMKKKKIAKNIMQIFFLTFLSPFPKKIDDYF